MKPTMLFDFDRPNSKATDLKVAQKANSTTTRKSVPTIKGGDSLIDRVNSASRFVEEKLGKYKTEFTTIQDKAELEKYVDTIIKNGIVSIDTETTGLDPLQDEIAGFSIYTPNEKPAYIPINHISYLTNLVVPNQLTKEEACECLQRALDENVDVIMFNADFDIRVLRNQLGLHNIYCTWDCYLAQRILNENEADNHLKPLYTKYVLNGAEDAFTFADFFKGIPFILVPLSIAYLYAANDAKITYEFYEYQRKYLREDSDREDMRKMYHLFMDIEMACVPVVADMEDNGIALDLTYQVVLSKKYNKLLDDKLKAFYECLAKRESDINKYRQTHPVNKLSNPINISSPTQLSILFYDILGYDVIDKKHPRGTGEDILQKMDEPIANAVLAYREVEKLLNTYIDKLPKCLNPNDGKVHGKFNQYGAKTGRFSSSEPNLQNIPSHNKDIRPMFVASPGYVLMSSDFSQQEPKCLAAMCRFDGDSQLYDTFMAGRQLYADIASIAFHKPYEECLEFRLDENGKETNIVNPEGKERRARAKKILLASLYGMGEKGIAEDLNIPLEEAKKIKDAVYKGVPAIPKFEQDSLNFAYQNGYVTTIAGRKRRLPELQLDEYEFHWIDDNASTDLLDFDDEGQQEIPERTIRKYLTQLHNCRFGEKKKIFEKANKEGIWIVDNGAKIADATRQCVNSRIQGSAADLTKLAMICVSKNERLKELGFRLLIQVHDELIGECPEENMKECSELLASIMSQAAETLLEMPIKCDVDVMKSWGGKKINV